ncbi:MAG: Regulatory protein Spx [Methanobacteriota archaeon]|jgi:arsenate reductase|nr:MAG: Regulatory protein Spx [Euryarchaeota archaeon]|tara:strand:- start:1379 stop:1774 length:396 start_codon:yes stop_codon:yes gene_type:complete
MVLALDWFGLHNNIGVFMNLKLYHNPRCSKSRQALNLLQERDINFQEIRYLNDGLNRSEIEGLISRYQGSSSDIVRIDEQEYKSNKIDLDVDSEIIELLLNYPKCLQRPLLDDGHTVVIGRPPENILTLLP